VKVSSKAPGLDASALEAAMATEFRPYRDGSGAFVPMPIDLSYSVSSLPSGSQGVLGYSCEQFALDETWWRSVWPAEKKSELHTMMEGIAWGAALQSSPSSKVEANQKAAISELDARWVKGIEACRARPNELWVDVVKPEGDWARRLGL